ncbi:metallophosphoesterase, partial [Pseudomonas syringae]|nr:metallophosphoesterase [Pseudomonas syringae]
GSAGRRRFKLPVTLAILEMNSDAIEPSLVQLVD